MNLKILEEKDLFCPHFISDRSGSEAGVFCHVKSSNRRKIPFSKSELPAWLAIEN